MDKLSKFIIRHRKAVIAVIIIITAIMGFFMKDLTINSDVLSYLPKSNPEVQLFDYIGQEYGGNLTALVAIESDEIFSKSTLKNINNLTDKFKYIDGVSSVTSLTNVIDIKKTDSGLEIGKLIDAGNLPETNDELLKVKKYTLSREMYKGRFISEDGKTALIICMLGKDADKVAASQKIREIVKEANMTEKAYFGGLPFLIKELGDILMDDLKILLPVICFLIIFTLGFSFRSFSGILLPLVSVLFSLVWTLGSMSILRIPLSLISDLIPVILMAVGSAYGIHVVNKFYDKKNSGNDKLESSVKNLKEIGVPVLLAGITTIAGFSSFIFGSYLQMIREFGIFTSLGILFALIISLTFIPAVLAGIHNKSGRHKEENDKNKQTLITRFMDIIAAFVVRRRKIFFLACIALIIISVFGIRRIEREVDFVDYFKQDSDTKITEEMMKVKFGGTVPVQILVKGDMTDPAVLGEIKNMQEFMQSHRLINNAQSIVDLIEEMNYIIGDGKEIPDTSAKISNLWFLLEGEEQLGQLVNMDKTEAVIHATIPDLNTENMNTLITDINNYISQSNPEQTTYAQTGLPVIYSELDRSITRSQFSSLIIAVALVFVCLVFLLRSPVGGIIGIIPMIASLVFIFAIMGFARIPLDIVTVLVGSIAIGIGIDYSIHIVNRFSTEYIELQDEEKAVKAALETSGKAILINMLTVTLGFLILLFSNIVPIQRFGLLVAMTMVVSGFSAMTLLMVIILLTMKGFFGKTVRKLFSKKLTRD